jgi:hypothetical protein
LVLKKNNIIGEIHDLTLAVGLISNKCLRSSETQEDINKIVTAFYWIEFLFFALVSSSFRKNVTRLIERSVRNIEALAE